MADVAGGIAAPTYRRGVAALVLAGFLFGSTFLVVQDAVGRVDVLPFLAVRFLIAGAVLWPIARRRPASPGEVKHGAAAGACLLVGYLLQTVGLQHTTAAASAFITYLLVVIVPVLHAARTRRLPGFHVVVGVVVAVIGLAALSGGVDGFGYGEALTLACAFGFAAHILVLGVVAGRHDPVRLTMWQVLTVGVACLVPGVFTDSGYQFDRGVWAAALFTGIGATAVAFWCMSWAQRVVPEAQAAIILLLEPVTAGVLGELVGEHLGPRGLIGAVLILVAVMVAELGGKRAPEVVGGELAVVVRDAVDAVDAVVDDGPSDGRTSPS